MNSDNIGDAELVRRVQEGEKPVFAILVLRHTRSVYRIIRGVLQNEADSEEILQETFLKALEHIGDFRGEAQFRTWLIQIALNEARMRRRKYRSGLYNSLDEEREENPGFRPRKLTDWRPSPEETLAREELASLLDQGVRSLPKIYREVLILRDVEQFSNEEAAQALGISISATKTRLLRARLMLREFLAPHLKIRWHERLFQRIKGQGKKS